MKSSEQEASLSRPFFPASRTLLRQSGEGKRKRRGMERSTPVRKPHTSTADLLTWPETPLPPFSPPTSDSTARRHPKPSGGISPALFGGPMTEEEIESVNNRKPCSGSKLREIAGSGIFAMENENDLFDLSTSSTTGLRIYQKAISGISQISFTAEESVSPKKPTSLPEIAKQRELSGNLDSESEAKAKKLLSNAKYKELSGNDIFGPPPENPPRVLAARNLDLKGHLDFGEPAPWNINTSVAASNLAGAQSAVMFTEQPALKTAKMIPNQKFQELTGNGIFKDDDASPPFAEKQLSSAKLKEISGSDIFADGKSSSRDYYGGVRKPPGGESSIALV